MVPFAKLIAVDLIWLFEGRGSDYGAPDPRLSLADVVAWISSCQKRWKKLLFGSRAAVTSHSALLAFGEWWQEQRLRECDGRSFPATGGVDPPLTPDGKLLQRVWLCVFYFCQAIAACCQ